MERKEPSAALIVTGECESEAIRWQTREPVRDLVAMLRVRRLRWLGHVLRMPEERRLRRFVLMFNTIYPDGYPEGSIFMDAPAHIDVAELVPMAGLHGPGRHNVWDGRVLKLKAELEC